jgi:hypothetical protein
VGSVFLVIGLTLFGSCAIAGAKSRIPGGETWGAAFASGLKSMHLPRSGGVPPRNLHRDPAAVSANYQISNQIVVLGENTG